MEFKTSHGTVHAVSDVSFSIEPGETVSLVGESGSGKSTVAKAIMGLIQQAQGSIRFEDLDLLQLPAKELRQVRPHLQMIFQDPTASLNPRRRIRDIVAEGLEIWPDRASGPIPTEVDDLLREVGINPDIAGRPQAKRVLRRPGPAHRHRPRARPASRRWLVCDEPVAALDVSVQAQILNLLASMKKRFGLTMLFIAHDLGVVKNVSDRGDGPLPRQAV